MPKEFTLRNKIAEAKAEFREKGGRDEYWSETLAWTLQDYHGSTGSVLDFTEDDWRATRRSSALMWKRWSTSSPTSPTICPRRTPFLLWRTSILGGTIACLLWKKFITSVSKTLLHPLTNHKQI